MAGTIVIRFKGRFKGRAVLNREFWTWPLPCYDRNVSLPLSLPKSGPERLYPAWRNKYLKPLANCLVSNKMAN